MLPQSVASTKPVAGTPYSPDNRVTSNLIDYELGGIELLDVSQGLMARVWKCWVEQDKVYLQGEVGGAVNELFQEAEISEISLTFDQSMRWAAAYTQGDDIKLNWFDTFANARVTTVFPGCRNPRLSLDDKRQTHLDSSDMILGYLKGSTLHFRRQRDRFSLPFSLRENVAGNLRLTTIGLTNKMRLQFGLAKS